nr:reverse transcriptase domain-containing protein [Tanacetum cinerariifolium]
MSAMANTTPIMTTVTKTATKEKTPNGAKTASRINILDFCEEHYEDILPVMDKICHDKRREVHTRLDFGEDSMKSQRMREDSQNSSAKTLSARYRNLSERPQIRDHLRNNDGNVIGRLGHRRKSAFKRLSDTYSPSTTKSGPDKEYSRDDSYSRGQIVLESGTAPTASKNRMVIPTPLTEYGTNIESGTNERGHWKSKSKRGKPTDKEDLAIETGRMKGAPECMRISGFMHGVNNLELTKHLNENVRKTLEEMMAATTAFIHEETATASKKKAHSPWKSQDLSKRQNSKRRSDFRNQPKDGRGSNKFTPLTITPKKNSRLSQENSNYHRRWRSTRYRSRNQWTCRTPHIRGRGILDGGDAEHYTRAWMNFMIVRSPSPYNGIIGRPGIREIQAVPSTAHEMLKFLVNGGIVTIRSTILTPTECTTIAATPKDHAKKAETRHENFKVAIHPDFPDQEITIGGTPSDMTGVPRSISEQRLNIREGYSPVRQKKQGQAPERAKAIQVEVQKLVEAGILREVYYHDWLSNSVMVKKYDGSWRINSNPFAATPLSVFWTPTKATIKYRWQNKMRKRQLSTPVTGVSTKSWLARTDSSPNQRKIFATFQNLKEVHQKSDFHWTPDAEKAFKQLKQQLARLLMLVVPKPMEELIMYLSASYEAISAVLMTERDTVQTPIYFVSRTLQAPELNYSPIEKPIKQVMSRPDMTRRLQKWSVMLGEHNITYRPRTSVKGQILADFLVEKPDDAPPDTSVLVEVLEEKSIQEEEVATVVEEEGPT